MFVLVLLAVTTSLAQRKHSYYVSIGPAITTGSEWGNGHKMGSTFEFGILSPLSSSWDVVVAVGIERFKLEKPVNSLSIDGRRLAGRWTNLQGGSDIVGSVKGGVRYRVATPNRFKPYVGALLGLSLAHQDHATVDWVPESPSDGIPVPAYNLQADNDQVAVDFSSIVGVSTRIWTGQTLLVEMGYTFVFTPDDSFDDNPSFFPVRVGVVF